MQRSVADTALRAEGISKRFPGVAALAGVHVDLRPGEVHVLAGANGAGKSTLIKVLAGVYPPDEGQLYMHDRPVHFRSPQEARAHGIAVIYQEFSLVPDLSVAENIFMGREQLKDTLLRRVDFRRQDAEAQAALARLGVEIDPRTSVRRLSVSQQQEVEAAKALSQAARIVIMDEPTAALTWNEIQNLFRIIRQLKTEGVAILYVSHRLEEAAQIGDRVTVLRDGRHVQTLPMPEVTHEDLVRLMIGRVSPDSPRPRRSHGPMVLEVDGASRRAAFHGVSLTLRRGEILGITGLVGSGRTELLRCIFGADPLDAGTIRVRGTPVHLRSPADAIRHGIFLIPEDRKMQGLVQVLSVLHNVSLASLPGFSRLLGLDLGSERRRAADLCRRLGVVAPSLFTQAMTLSGGNQQKVVVAKGLCADPAILLFDEPTRGVDVRGKGEIHRIIDELAEAGTAIIVVSSELDEVLGLSDRLLVMRRGEIVAEVPRDRFDHERVLQYAVLGRDAQRDGHTSGH